MLKPFVHLLFAC